LYIIARFFKNKEFINPEVYLNFIKNELLESKEIALRMDPNNPGPVYKHYLRLIFLYSSMVLISLILIFLYVNSI
jgi:hypothetical protein